MSGFESAPLTRSRNFILKPYPNEKLVHIVTILLLFLIGINYTQLYLRLEQFDRQWHSLGQIVVSISTVKLYRMSSFFIAKKKVKSMTVLVNLIIDPERPFKKIIKKGEYKAIKCHSATDDCDSGYCEINLPYYGGGSREECFVWEDKLLKASDGQSIGAGPQRYTFT